MQWICDVCGYIHDDEGPPDVCPVCEAPASKFREFVDDDDRTHDSDFLQEDA